MLVYVGLSYQQIINNFLDIGSFQFFHNKFWIKPTVNNFFEYFKNITCFAIKQGWLMYFFPKK